MIFETFTFRELLNSDINPTLSSSHTHTHLITCFLAWNDLCRQDRERQTSSNPLNSCHSYHLGRERRSLRSRTSLFFVSEENSLSSVTVLINSYVSQTSLLKFNRTPASSVTRYKNPMTLLLDYRLRSAPFHVIDRVVHDLLAFKDVFLIFNSDFRL